ncbi:hypothetical protein [Blautia massiliensis (ex Durand et al. 2017)]|uniref:hypothetical protein n=1 Tax=Blautia massiliensis (ex Durand et al. 2017) TaxID=1737424 RepID=UPI0022E53739|nr:hypothetical protein [Blautia massiliensis (ex Durand et al. 2017)]
MEFKGRIASMFRDLVTGNWNVTFSTNQNIEEALQTFSGKEMDVKLKQHREKRSLDANAYYWCLLTKLARIHGWSNAEAHNRMLRDYGQYERVEGQLIAVPLPDTDQTEREILNKMEYHLALSPKITIMKGQTKRIYLLLRGSSTYNTEEMARLISGLIDECRWSGIPDSEIMTPFEKQKLYEQYGIGEKHEQ